MSDSQYDEPGSRTRQAWLRTSLGVIAVSVLVVRGMLLQGAPGILILATALPAGVFLVVAMARTRSLGPAESAGVRPSGVLLACGAGLGIAVVAVVSVLGP